MSSIVKRNCGTVPNAFQRFWNTDLFNGFFDDDQPNLPAVNVVEKEKEFAIDISVPGFSRDNIAIEIDKNQLRISATVENENEEKGSDNKVIRREFSSSAFERSFVIPENIDTDNIAAKQENGILKITLPKRQNASEDTVKKISVQ